MKPLNRLRINQIFHSFRVQLIIYYIVISFIVLAIGSYFSSSIVLGVMKNNNQKYVLQQFHQAEYNISKALNDVEAILNIFMLENDVQTFINLDGSSTDFERFLNRDNTLKTISQYTANYPYLISFYLLRDDGTGFGGNESYTSFFDKSTYTFYITKSIIKKAETDFPNILLVGGNSEKVAGTSKPVIYKHLISEIKGVRSISNYDKMAAVVINIDERYISTMYSVLGDSNNSRLYMLDGTGKIISAGSAASIGKEYPFFKRLNVNKSYDSFMANNNKQIQVVYYKMKNTGMYLVAEQSLGYLSKDIQYLQKVIWAIFILSFLTLLVVTYFWLNKVTKPINLIASKLRDVSKGNLGITFSQIPKNEFEIIIRRFNEMSTSILELVNNNSAIQEEKRRMEVDILKAQINPHFLYNTLNMIKWMAASSKDKRIIECVVALGNIIMPVFKNSDTMCMLKEDIEYIENYIKILNWRFGDKFKFIFKVDENCMNLKIPRFIIQPIIENSVTHGLSNEGGPIEIGIEAFRGDGGLKVIVSDTGVGMDEARLQEISESLLESVENSKLYSKNGIGLRNVQRRIKIIFGEKYGVKIHSILHKGTIVNISLPEIY